MENLVINLGKDQIVAFAWKFVKPVPLRRDSFHNRPSYNIAIDNSHSKELLRQLEYLTRTYSDYGCELSIELSDIPNANPRHLNDPSRHFTESKESYKFIKIRVSESGHSEIYTDGENLVLDFSMDSNHRLFVKLYTIFELYASWHDVKLVNLIDPKSSEITDLVIWGAVGGEIIYYGIVDGI